MRIAPDEGSEYASCQANGVTDVIEIQVGLDGIAFRRPRVASALNLTPKSFTKRFLALPLMVVSKPPKDLVRCRSLAARPAHPRLRSAEHLWYARRAERAVLEAGCDTSDEMKALKDSDEDRHARLCTEVRSDGLYVDQGEQDNLIVQKIEGNPNAVGVFGYSYLEENVDKVQGLEMNGVALTYENIANFDYPGARPLYVYVKKAHLDAIPGLKEYLAQWTKMWAKDGDLAKIGLVASPEDVMATNQKAATEYTTLDGAQLKWSESTLCRQLSCSSRALGLGLAGWLAARARAWAFRRDSAERRLQPAGLPCVRVALWIVLPMVAFIALWSSIAPVWRRSKCSPGRGRAPSVRLQRQTILNEARGSVGSASAVFNPQASALVEPYRDALFYYNTIGIVVALLIAFLAGAYALRSAGPISPLAARSNGWSWRSCWAYRWSPS